MSRVEPSRSAAEAPHPHGTVRLSLVFDDGSGTSGFYDPERLPDLMRAMDRMRDVRGRTYRRLAEDRRGWAKLRDTGLRLYLGKSEGQREQALLLLLYCYMRHPQAGVADKLAASLAENGRATVSLFVNRATGAVGCVVSPTYSEAMGRVTFAATLPPGQTVVIDLEPEMAGRA